MKIPRTIGSSHRMTWVGLLAAALLLSGPGCRKQESESTGAPQPPPAAEPTANAEGGKETAAEPTSTAPADTPKAGTAGAPSSGAAETSASAAAGAEQPASGAEKTPPPGTESAGTPATEAAAPAASADGGAAPTGQGPDRIETPTPAVDRDRLKALFVEMWCAEHRGASAEELLAIYNRHDYPPLDNWYAVWHQANLDTQWTRSIVEAARSACWDVVKDKVAPAAQPEGAPAAQPEGAPAAQPEGAPAAQPEGAPAAQPEGAPAAPTPAAEKTGQP